MKFPWNPPPLIRLGILQLVFLLALQSMAHAASLVASIDLSRQTMAVSVDGRLAYSWRVSTARPGYRTPIGSFTPKRLERSWFSRKYDNAPMPHSVFFYGGYAIHGTTDIRHLGQPVSHGCVRLHPDNARLLFNLVRKHGMGATRIVVRR